MTAITHLWKRKKLAQGKPAAPTRRTWFIVELEPFDSDKPELLPFYYKDKDKEGFLMLFKQTGGQSKQRVDNGNISSAGLQNFLGEFMWNRFLEGYSHFSFEP